MPRRSSLVLLPALLAPLAGCADYLNHRDSVTFGAGNAKDANAAIETIDPWPPSSARTTIDSDGRIVKRAIDTYAAPPSKDQAKPVASP